MLDAEFPGPGQDEERLCVDYPSAAQDLYLADHLHLVIPLSRHTAVQHKESGTSLFDD